MIDETTIPRHYPHFGAESRPEAEEKPTDFVDKIRFNCSAPYREDAMKRLLDRMEALVLKLRSSALEKGKKQIKTFVLWLLTFNKDSIECRLTRITFETPS